MPRLHDYAPADFTYTRFLKILEDEVYEEISPLRVSVWPTILLPALRSKRAGNRAFTLIELLVVVAIMGLLAAISLPALKGLSGAEKFTQEIGQITGILEQARSYAMAQNTYVWVAIYPYDPSMLTPSDASGDALFIATLASNDGSDPIGWTSASVVPVPGIVSGTTTTISEILRVASFKQITIRTQNYFTQGSGASQIASLPSGIEDPLTGPSATPTFQITVKGVSAASLILPATVPSDAPTAQAVSVIQFTPSGAARINGSPIDSVWIDLQRAKAKGVIDADNIAAIRINGLTGLTSLYRK